MVYVNQIHPIKYTVKENKNFLELLFNNSDLTEVNKWFDYLDCSVSIRRQLDNEMNLKRFLSLLTKNSMISLQLASPDPFEIRYGVRLEDKQKDKRLERFLFIEYPYTEKNFSITSFSYKRAFGINLEEEPVLDGLFEYYLHRLAHYPNLRKKKDKFWEIPNLIEEQQKEHS